MAILNQLFFVENGVQGANLTWFNWLLLIRRLNYFHLLTFFNLAWLECYTPFLFLWNILVDGNALGAPTTSQIMSDDFQKHNFQPFWSDKLLSMLVEGHGPFSMN